MIVTLLALAAGGCERARAPQEGSPHPRMVTFSPALTQMVFDMGLGEHVVGVTSFCRLPAGQTRPAVGNALSIRSEPILAVRPDVLLTQIEVKRFEALRKADAKVRIEHFEIETLGDLADAMERLGRIAGKPAAGKRAAEAFRNELAKVRSRTSQLPRRRVLFVMGYQRPSGPGTGTFLHEMIELAGGQNLMGMKYDGWKNISVEEALQLAPEVLICLTNQAGKDKAGEYWRTLGARSAAGKWRTVMLTDSNWTIPAGHLAGLTARLAQIIHPETAGEGANRG